MQSNFETANRSLAGVWAKKYVQNLSGQTTEHSDPGISERTHTAKKLADLLRFCTSRAWAKTEDLLFEEIQKHQIDANLIDPWKIASDSRSLFEKALDGYQNDRSPEQFSVSISQHCGRIRQQHTTVDPRVLGFLSMQFHYTGQFLLEELSPAEKRAIGKYLKVMDDHLYMPLQRSYDAAGEQDWDSPTLGAVQRLLAISTSIAETITAQVAAINPHHQCYTGDLNHPEVRISSIRDVEMFQIYLCLCTLEDNITSVQQELFPLCIMLYPPLKVHWNLVQQLILLLHQEIRKRLNPEDYHVFAPSIKAFNEMFAEDILIERHVA